MSKKGLNLFIGLVATNEAGWNRVTRDTLEDFLGTVPQMSPLSLNPFDFDIIKKAVEGGFTLKQLGELVANALEDYPTDPGPEQEFTHHSRLERIS